MQDKTTIQGKLSTRIELIKLVQKEILYYEAQKDPVMVAKLEAMKQEYEEDKWALVGQLSALSKTPLANAKS